MSRKDFEYLPNLNIDDILLDVSNPRIRTGSNQQDCINRVLRKEEQMLNLIKSIAKDGLTTMPILVCPHGTDQNKWIVKDGNRRVTALKLLNDQNLCIDIELRKKFKQSLRLIKPISPIPLTAYRAITNMQL